MLELNTKFGSYISYTGCFKKSIPQELFGIFSLRLSNFANLLEVHIHIYLPIFADLSQYFIKWCQFFHEYPSFLPCQVLSIHPENENININVNDNDNVNVNINMYVIYVNTTSGFKGRALGRSLPLTHKEKHNKMDKNSKTEEKLKQFLFQIVKFRE